MCHHDIYSHSSFSSLLVALISFLHKIKIGYVNGEQTQTDAQSVAEQWGLDYRFWAFTWLITSFVAFVIGLVFARDARVLNWNKQSNADITAATASATQQGTTAANTSYVAYLA
jgi:hypothetical protein